MADNDEVLLGKINAAVADHNAAEKAVTTARSELVSKSKVVGHLLLEAKNRHPKVADFESFLKRVNGLKLSRAYDLLRLAGGRTTDEELRQDARERVRKHRAKRKIPKPAAEPVSVTGPDVTESPKRITQSPEISEEERRAQNAALDQDDLSIPAYLDRRGDHSDDNQEKPEPVLLPGGQSAYYLELFINACRDCLCRVSDEGDRAAAIRAWTKATQHWNKKAKAA